MKKGIVVDLSSVLMHKKLKLTDISRETGITMANLSILKTGKARAIRFSTLQAICEVLACQPGDILKYR